MKTNLIIAAVGDESMHKYWMDSNQDYDLILIYYGDNNGYPKDANMHINKKGTKFHLIADLIKENPNILSYEYIWMPDDDIVAYPEDIEKLFYFTKKYDLWIAQPSIMGWYGLDITLHHKNSTLRYTNYVEIMCPCFKNQALKKCLNTFKYNKTGWGIDSIWNVILNNPTNKLAIIDDVVVIHTRPIGKGDMYKNQIENKDKSVNEAMKEAEEIYKKYNLGKSSYNDLKSGKLVSQELFYLNYFNTVEYGRIYKQNEAGIDVSERFWPPTSITKNICINLRSSKPNLSVDKCLLL